ncbi:MAG: DUF1499 domain-containing protein [Porticoccaceae bacterium]
MAIVAKSPRVLDQLEKIISFLAQLCIVLLCLDVLGFRMGILPGFVAISALYIMFAFSGIVCLIGLIVIIYRFIINRRVGVELLLLLLLVSMPLVIRFPVLGVDILQPSNINDVSTDIDSPPDFTYAASLRSPSQNALEDQTSRYRLGFAARVPGVEPLLVDMPLRGAFRQASYVVALEGWSVVKEDLESGCIEAIARSPIMGFESDIVIRIVPVSRDSSILDIRSSSRDVADDYGLNATQIRSFLKKYQAL